MVRPPSSRSEGLGGSVVCVTVKDTMRPDRRVAAEVPAECTFSELKERLAEQQYDGAAVERLRLLFQGRWLLDTEVVGTIAGGSDRVTVHLVVRPADFDASRGSDARAPDAGGSHAGGSPPAAAFDGTLPSWSHAERRADGPREIEWPEKWALGSLTVGLFSTFSAGTAVVLLLGACVLLDPVVRHIRVARSQGRDPYASVRAWFVRGPSPQPSSSAADAAPR